MPGPLLIWGGIALVSVIAGSAGTLAVTDKIDDFGDAAEQTGNAVSKIALSVGALGVGYVAYQNRAAIADFMRRL